MRRRERTGLRLAVPRSPLGVCGANVRESMGVCAQQALGRSNPPIPRSMYTLLALTRGYVCVCVTVCVCNWNCTRRPLPLPVRAAVHARTATCTRRTCVHTRARVHKRAHARTHASFKGRARVHSGGAAVTRATYGLDGSPPGACQNRAGLARPSWGRTRIPGMLFEALEASRRRRPPARVRLCVHDALRARPQRAALFHHSLGARCGGSYAPMPLRQRAPKRVSRL